jgi:hypothetical protein
MALIALQVREQASTCDGGREDEDSRGRESVVHQRGRLLMVDGEE